VRDARHGHASFTGELVGATEAEVTIAVSTTPPTLVAIPYADIRKSNLVEE
jgi:ribosome maturation factor RimP